MSQERRWHPDAERGQHLRGPDVHRRRQHRGGADNALGNSNGKVLLNGGALVFNNSFSLSNNRNVELASNNGTLSANAGVTGTLTQVVSGAGT